MFPVQWFINNWIWIWISTDWLETGSWFIMVIIFYFGTFTEIGQKLMKSAIFIVWVGDWGKWVFWGQIYSFNIGSMSFILFLTLPPFGHNPNSFLKIFLLCYTKQFVSFSMTSFSTQKFHSVGVNELDYWHERAKKRSRVRALRSTRTLASRHLTGWLPESITGV